MAVNKDIQQQKYMETEIELKERIMRAFGIRTQIEWETLIHLVHKGIEKIYKDRDKRAL